MLFVGGVDIFVVVEDIIRGIDPITLTFTTFTFARTQKKKFSTKFDQRCNFLKKCFSNYNWIQIDEKFFSLNYAWSKDCADAKFMQNIKAKFATILVVCLIPVFIWASDFRIVCAYYIKAIPLLFKFCHGVCTGFRLLHITASRETLNCV